MFFASDNAAGIAPEIMDAIARANVDHALGYGNDEDTRRLERSMCELFEREVEIFLVPTGTAANALALAQFSPPWGAVFCHENAHIVTSEAGAPEFFGGGLKLVELPGEGGKVSVETLQAKLERTDWSPPHHIRPAILSVTQASEAGTIYRVSEIAELAAVCHASGIAVHMDGARFANALVSLNATPAEATWKPGVDVLSFGATKGGAMAAEAVVFFDKERAAEMGRRRKRGGQLVSKHRFMTVQFEAFLRDNLWLRLARHANAQAQRLADGLGSIGFAPVWPVEANLVFGVLPPQTHERLQKAGATYYVVSGRLPPSQTRTIGHLVRLVTSFATQAADVDRFVEVAAGG